MTLRWFISSAVRDASAMRKHVYHMLCAQRDILSPQAIEGVNASLAEISTAIRSGAKAPELKAQMGNLEKSANKWLKPYPSASWREHTEIVLVTVAVAMAIRTFFIQPFKIPTGSMQPTLFGVTDKNWIDDPDFKVPTGLNRLNEWIHGRSYVHVAAKNDGPLEQVREPMKFLIFGIYQSLTVGGAKHSIWLPPDYGTPPQGTLPVRAQLDLGKEYTKGQDVVKLQINAGDYLFVDRLTYNFRKPTRGEIIVFETGGIEQANRAPASGQWFIPGDQFYIKRLVALSGENVRIDADHHLVIDGKRLEATAPGFENVYSYDPAKAEDNLYFGHWPVQLFANGSDFTIRTNHFMVMGDNTKSSLDSRYFGDVDANRIIGKSWVVYWPLTSRFGLGYR